MNNRHNSMQSRQSGIPTLPTAAIGLVALLAATAVMAMVYLGASAPITSWRADLSTQTEQLRSALHNGPELRRTHAALSKQYDELMTRVADVIERMPDQPRDDEFLADVSRLAESCGVFIEDFRRGAVTQAETHASVTVMLTARAPYQGLCKLVHAIDELPRLSELKELSVESEPGSEDYPVTLHYTLYYAKSPPAT